MEKRGAYGLCIISVIIGLWFLGNSSLNFIGAAIGVSESVSKINSFLGIFFVLMGVSFLFILKEKNKVISDLVKFEYNKNELDDINHIVRTEYGGRHLQNRRELYQEIAKVMSAAKENNEDVLRSYKKHIITAGYENLHLPRDKKIFTLDADVLNRFERQGSRGTERYVFDNKNKKMLGIAYHPRGNPTQLEWRIRF